MSRISPSLLANSASPSAITVASKTGFAAGEYIYYSNGDYVQQSALTAPSVAQFNATVAGATNQGGAASVFSPIIASPTTIRPVSGTRSAAVLSNGDIVQVFSNVTDNLVYFQIITAAGASVVAPTSVSATLLGSAIVTQPTVAALTGGGFVVYYINSSGGTANKPTYAIYTNAGGVTLAANNDTTYAATSGSMIPNIVALANGGFTLVTMDSSTGLVSFKVLTSTGTVTKAWTTSGITGLPAASTANNVIGLAARSDSSFIIATVNSASAYSYALFNSSGTAIVAATTFTNTTPAWSVSSTTSAMDVTCLSDGTTFVFGMINGVSSPQYIGFRLLPTGNTLGSLIYYSDTAYNADYGGYNNCSLLALSTGGFICAWGGNYTSLFYAVFNSSAVPVSGTSGGDIVPRIIPGCSYPTRTAMTILDYNGYYNFYVSSRRTNNPTASTSVVQVSKSTYNVVPTSSYSYVASTTTNAVTTYSQSNSNGSGASYLATNTESVVVQNPVSFASPIYYGDGYTESIATATLSNGNLLLVYLCQNSSSTSRGAIYALILNRFGQTIAKVLVNSAALISGNTNGGYSVACAGMQGGKFAIGYFTGNTTFTVAIFNSSYQQTYVTTLAATYNNSATRPNMCGTTQDKLIVQPLNTTSVYCYDNTLTLRQTITVQGDRLGKVIPDNNGGFYVGAAISATSYNVAQYNYTATNTWTVGVTNTPSTVNSQVIGSLAASSNFCVFPINANATATITFYGQNLGYTLTSMSVTLNLGSNTGAPTSASASYVVGQTGDGIAFGISDGSLNNFAVFPGLNSSYPGNFVTTVQNFSQENVFTGTGSAGSLGAYFQTAPSYGNTALVAWLNINRQLTYGILSVGPTYVFNTVTSNTTASNPVPIIPYQTPGTTNTNSVITNAVLVGVSTTAASANGSGQVVTNGTASLNSNYSATQPYASFDHQQPNGTSINGVKGSVLGQLVTLSGNT